MTLTELECEVAWRIRRGTDPWAGTGGPVGSRRVSATLGRLQRKGAVSYAYTSDGPEWTLTPEGRVALDAKEGPSC